VHRLWKIEETEAVKMISTELLTKAIFIADGHHRTKTALSIKRESRRGRSSGDKPYDYVLMFLCGTWQTKGLPSSRHTGW